MDVDGNEYIDHNLCFGTLMAGHGHPAVVKAVAVGAAERRHLRHAPRHGSRNSPRKSARAIPSRWCASARAARKRPCTLAASRARPPGRDKILRFEGCYHGLHDTALVSVKPKEEDYGDINAPNSVPGGLGVIQAVLDNVTVATFNNLPSVEHRFKQFPDKIAAIILEPIMMNVGICMPQPGFLEGLRENSHQERRVADL